MLAPALSAESVADFRSNGRTSSSEQSERSGNFFTRLRIWLSKDKEKEDEKKSKEDDEDDDDKKKDDDDDDDELTDEERKERHRERWLRNLQRLREKRKKEKRRGQQSQSQPAPGPSTPPIAPATGITRTWDGAGTNSFWRTDDNWVTGTPNPGDALVFGGTVLTNSNNFTAGTAFYGLTFDNTAGAFNLGGNRITLAGPITNSSTSTQTISLAVRLAANVTVNAASGDILISGPLSGAFGITKTGASMLRLTGSNTFSGGTTFTNGELFVDNNAALGSGTLIITSAGGTTTLGTNVDQTTLNNQILFQGASANLTIAAGGTAGHLNFNGNVNLNGATRTITGTKHQMEVKFAGGISGGAGVNFATTHTNPGDYTAFLFTTPNTYTGLTTIGSGAFVVLLGNTANGAIKGNVLIEGTGVLDYLGGASEQVADTATVTVNSTGNSAGATNFGGFDLFNVHGTETIGALFGSGTVWLADSTLRVGSGNFTGVISDGTHGAAYVGGKLTKYGTGTLVLSGLNTYTGATTVSAGNLQVGVGGVGSTGTGPTTVAAAGTLSGTGTVSATTLNGNLQPGDGGGTGAEGTLTINGNFTATATTSVLTFEIRNPTGTWADYVAANPGLGLTGDAMTELNTDDGITAQGDYDSRISDLANFYENADPAAGDHDKLKVNGTFTINGSTKIDVSNLGVQSNLVAGQVFNLIDATTFVTTGFNPGGDERLGGTIDNLTLPTLDAAYLWDTTKFLTHGLLIVVDPPVYWTGGAAGEADPTSWTEAGNWLLADGSAALAPDATTKVVISHSGGATNQNAMTLNQDLAIRQLVINDSNETSLSGSGALTITPMVDDGSAHGAITVNSDAGKATINTDLKLSQGARITVNNVDEGSNTRGLVLTGDVSAKTKLIKSGPGNLTFQGATMTIGSLNASVAETLTVQYEGSGGITLQNSALKFDIFSNGSADKLIFAGSLEGGNRLALNDTHFDVAYSGGATLTNGKSWDLLDWQNVDTFEMLFTGDIANYFNLPTLGAGHWWAFDRFATEGVIYVVPEPSRAMLLLAAFALMHLRRRRR